MTKMEDGSVQELSEGWQATLALGFEPLPYIRGQGRQAGMQACTSGRVTGCRRAKQGGGESSTPVGVRAYFDPD